MKDLSVIIPFANEFPQVVFTIRAIIEELRGRCNFEVIAIDNYCEELHLQKKTVRVREHLRDEITMNVPSYQFPDPGGEIVEGSQRVNNGHLRYFKYDEKLSHWNSKNVGIQEAEGEFFLFLDAHVLPSRGSISRMFQYWRHNHAAMDGTINLPLTYKILETKRLIYKLAIEDDGTVHYKFTPFPLEREVFEVPCMSACGVLMHKSIMEKLGGGFPKLLGIYGGGENFLNFTLRTMGVKSYIFPHGWLFHHGYNREYYWNGDDYTRNRAIANFFIGGEKYMRHFLSRRKGNRATLDFIGNQVIEHCADHAAKLSGRRNISIETWVEKAIDREWLTDKKMIDTFRKTY